MANKVSITVQLKDLFSKPAEKVAAGAKAIEQGSVEAARRIPVIGRELDRIEQDTDKSAANFRDLAAAVRTLTGRAIIAGLRRFGTAIRGFAGGTLSLITNLRRAVFSLRTAFIGLFAILTGAIIRRFVGVAVDVQQQIREIGTLLPDVDDAGLDELSRRIREVAVEGGQRFQDEFKAAYDAISSGVAADDLIDFLRNANRLAVGGVTDVSTAVDLLTSVLNGYGLAATDAERVSDALFTTVRLGKTTIDELASSIGRVAPIASEVGIEIEELGAAFAVTTAGGLSTDEAGTAIRAFLTEIISITPEARRELAALGVDLTVSGIRANGLAKTIEDLAAATGGSSEVLNRYVNNVRALNGVLILAAQGGERLRSVTEQFEDAAGATEFAFQRLATTAGFQLARFRAGFFNLINALSEQALPQIELIFRTLADAAQLAAEIVETGIGGDRASAQLVNVVRDLGSFIVVLASEFGRTAANVIIEVLGATITVLTPAIRRIFNDAIGPILETASLGLIEFEPSVSAKIEDTQRRLLDLEAARVERAAELATQQERLNSLLQDQADGVTEVSRRVQKFRTEYEDRPLFDLIGGRSVQTGTTRIATQVADGFKTIQVPIEQAITELQNSLDNNIVDITDRVIEQTRDQLARLNRELDDENAAAQATAGAAVRGAIDGLNEDLARSDQRIRASIDTLSQSLGLLGEEVRTAFDKIQQQDPIELPPPDSAVFIAKATEALDAFLQRTRAALDDFTRQNLGLNDATVEEAQARLLALDLQRREALARGSTELANAIAFEQQQLQEITDLRLQYLEDEKNGTADLADTIERLNAVRSVQQTERAAFDFNRQVREITDELADATARYEAASRDLQIRQQAGLIVTAEQREQTQALRDTLLDLALASREALRELAGNNPEFAANLESVIAQVENQIIALGGSGEQAGRTIADGIISGIQQLRDRAGSIFQQVQQITVSLGESLSSGLGGAFADVITGVEDAATAFRNFAREFLNQIVRMIAQALIFRTLFGTAGGTGGLFGGLFGFTDGGQIPGYAGGGRIQGPWAPTGSDNLLIRAERDEFMQPRSAVNYYGLPIMEAIRKRLIPKDLLQRFATSPRMRLGMGYTDGGSVGDGMNGGGGIGTTIIPTDEVTMDRLVSAMSTGLNRWARENRGLLRQTLGVTG